MKKYLLTAINTSAGNLKYKRVEAENITEAMGKLEVWEADTIKKHFLVVFDDKKVVEITDDMEIVRFTKTNGYKLSNDFSANIEEWENKLQSIFGNELMIIEHFYYGDKLDMADVVLKDGNYMQYNIGESTSIVQGILAHMSRR